MKDRRSTQWVIQLQKGKYSAIGDLFKTHKSEVLAYSEMLCPKNQKTAEDLAHEIFLAIYLSRFSFSIKAESFSEWFWRTARAASFTVLKRRKEIWIPEMTVESSTKLEGALGEKVRG